MKGAAWSLALCLLWGSLRATAQEVVAPSARVEGATAFYFEREGLKPPRWGIELAPDRTGSYWEPSAVSAANPAGKVLKPITVSAATWSKIANVKDRVVTGNCETKLKRIANTGRKEMSFVVASETRSCVFNYSDDKAMMEASDTFQAIAETMQAGARLVQKHRFDRLGLDPEMNSLAQSVKDGRAIELVNIAPVLRSLVSDGEVLERVRNRASAWLAQMPGSAQP